MQHLYPNLVCDIRWIHWTISFNGFILLFLLLAYVAVVLATFRYIRKHRKTDCRHGDNKLSPCPVYASSYKEILQSLNDQEFLVNFTNYINSAGDFPNRLQKTLHILGKYTNVDRISVFEDYLQGKMTKNTYEWCKQGITSVKEYLMQIAYTAEANEWKAMLMKDGTLHTNSITHLPIDVKNLPAWLTVNKSFFIFPLYVRNEFHGLVTFENAEAFNWDIGFLKTISMIISNAFERSFAEEEIKSSETKFKDLFNHSSDVVFIFNHHGDLIEINNRACEALEIPREELIRKKIEVFFPANQIPKEQLLHSYEQNNIKVFESEFKTKTGKIFPVEINSRPIHFNSKDAILCMARDISERKEMQREILSAIIQTEEKERGRLARDLHDGLGPLLSSLKLYVKVLGITTDQEKRTQMLRNTNEVIDESMILIKEISNNLSPHVLNDFGLASAIQSFCKKITFTKEIEIKFDSNVFDHRFEKNVEGVLFRVLKELVNNTIKHALATRIEIFLLRTENTLSLVYSDNGIGFDFKKMLDNKTSGMGISNIVNRINSINGRFLFESQTGRGIQLKMDVELKSIKN
jgi:PAS domain S-box-containing protein